MQVIAQAVSTDLQWLIAAISTVVTILVSEEFVRLLVAEVGAMLIAKGAEGSLKKRHLRRQVHQGVRHHEAKRLVVVKAHKLTNRKPHHVLTTVGGE